MASQNSMAIHPVLFEIFHLRLNCQLHAAASSKVRGSPKSVGFILWGRMNDNEQFYGVFNPICASYCFPHLQFASMDVPHYLCSSSSVQITAFVTSFLLSLWPHPENVWRVYLISLGIAMARPPPSHQSTSIRWRFD